MSRFITRALLAGCSIALAACSDAPAATESALSPTGANTANVLNIKSLAITPSTIAPMTIGDTVVLSVIGTSSSGTKYPLRNVQYVSSNPAVASVTGSVVKAVSGGTATVTTTLWGMTSSVVVPVNAPVQTVKTVSVSLASASINAGGSTQATAVLTDAAGKAVTGQTVTWASSNPAVATVSATGLVTAVTAGTANIAATSSGISGSATATVLAVAPPPPPATGETFATLPRVYLNSAEPVAPAAGGTIISVPAGGNLQTAINTAQPGDVIELANGATYSGNFILPNKNTTSTNWIVIRAANRSALPAQGVRMTPTIAAAMNMPKVMSVNNQGAFQTAAGAHHYRLTGFEVSVPASITNTGLVRLGDDGSAGQTTQASIPQNFVIDRMFIHGTTTGTVRRCIALNSGNTAVVDSWISDCHDLYSDAQAIEGWNGPGPFKIVNNYLEGSGENVMFGGGDPGVVGLIPSDIEIRRNHITKPLSWKGVWLIKNLLELKNAQRVLIEGNVIESNWQAAQGGSAINMKTVNQTGTCTWCFTGDVTLRGNLIRNVGSGFNISGSPDNTFADIHAARLTIMDNVMIGINASADYAGDGRGLLLNGDPSDVVFVHNTVIDPTLVGVYLGPPGSTMPRASIRDNIIGGGLYGIKGDNTGAGSSSISTYMPGGTFLGNVMSISAATGFPTGNYYPTSSASMGFTNLAGGNVQLLSTSPYKGKATDGRDPGADYNAMLGLTSGVIVAP